MDEYGQFRKPVGGSGRRMLEQMNEHHRSLAEWALGILPKTYPRNILDIGCGGGMLLSLLSEKYESKLYGIDISDESVRMTSEYNANLISSGRLKVSLDSVSEIPFNDGTLDLVTAFETYFFWPNLADDLVEIGRVVAENGFILIASEVYPHPDFNERNEKLISAYGMNVVDNESMAVMLEDAGFEVEIVEVEENNWVAFLGRKITV